VSLLQPLLLLSEELLLHQLPPELELSEELLLDSDGVVSLRSHESFDQVSGAAERIAR
jgi:hypothetical protein